MSWLGLQLKDPSWGSHSKVLKALAALRIPESKGCTPLIGSEASLALYAGCLVGDRLEEQAQPEEPD